MPMRACPRKLEADRSLWIEDLPMSILDCCLIFVEDSTDKTVRALSRWGQ